MNKTDWIDEMAGKAAQGILNGIYSNPGMFEIASNMASDKGLSLQESICDTAYNIAHSMFKYKLKTKNYDTADNKDGNNSQQLDSTIAKP